MRIVRAPSFLHAASTRRMSAAGLLSPTRRRISAADFGITGSSRIAATRTASATSNSTCDSSPARVSSRAIAQGSVLAMNSLAASTIWNAAAGAALEREPVHRLTVVVHGLPGHTVQTPGLTGGRKTSAAVLLGHRRNPADEIPQVVGEIDVVAILVALP